MATTTLHIFDLDDTLVQYRKKKVSVPRQTFHALKSLSTCKLAIISYNPGANSVVGLLGLTKYIDGIVCDAIADRVDLMKRMFSLLMNDTCTTIHYWDDRLDNLEAIQTYYPFIECHHVPDPCLLYMDLRRT